jgi:hypothetical protein
MALQGQAGEILLMGPEPLLSRVGGGLYSGGGRSLLHRTVLEHLGLHHSAVEDPLHVVLNEGAVGQGPGAVVVPEGIELLLHPGDGLGVIAFPEQLVVELPGPGALVDAAQEEGAAAIGVADHPGLAVDEP